ncbi:MAG: NAD+ synthase [Gemmatimonadaceae bacterium]
MPLTLALAQFRPVKGDYAANLARVGELFKHVVELTPRPTVLHLPETSLSGYFVEGGVREVAVTAGTLARDLDAAFREASQVSPHPLDVVIGFYERWRGTLYNSAAYVRLGEGAARVVHVHRKAFLPTYGLFDEERFVERGHDVRAFDTPWGRAAILVCEDAWHGLSGALAALDDAQVIFVSSAAPARGLEPGVESTPGPSSMGRWERLIRGMAEEHGVFVSLVNLVGSEGGKMFAGGSCVAGPFGDVRVRAPVFDEAIAVLQLEFADIERARADTPLLADLRTALPHLRDALSGIERGNRTPVEFDAATADGGGHVQETASRGRSARGAPPKNHDTTNQANGRHPSTANIIISLPSDADVGASGPPGLDIDAELTADWLTRFIRDEMARRGLTKGVVGISGGVDSAVTAFLAARALGPDNVLALRLPYRTSSADSLAHAQLVIDALSVPHRTIDISAAVDGFLTSAPDADPTRRGNVMARTRMIALFDQSAAIGGVPLGTGNKTERLFGYFTWHADDSPPINPLGDLFKTQVWALARYLGVPEVIVAKPASADLITGQTDEGDFGISYAKADAILNWLVNGFTARECIAKGFDADEVERVQRRLDGTHWKRRLPTVAMLSQSAIGESYLRPVDY